MRSLQTRAQATAVAGSAMWWPMCEARGEKIVRSVPRSRAIRSWLPSIVCLISSSLISGAAGTGRVGSASRASCASRYSWRAAGAVV